MSDRLCSSASKTCVDTPALFACSRENVRFPANNKWFRNLAVARIVAEQLESLGMKFPEHRHQPELPGPLRCGGFPLSGRTGLFPSVENLSTNAIRKYIREKRPIRHSN